MVEDDEDAGAPSGPQERRDLRVVVFPRSKAVVHDTWRVSGLRGTGSHDYEVADLFVPSGHVFRMLDDRHAPGFPHERLPLMGSLAAALGAVMLGMARGALDALAEQVRARRIGAGRVADQLLIQVRVRRRKRSYAPPAPFCTPRSIPCGAPPWRATPRHPATT